MYDLNGLKLSPVNKTMNAYYLTSVDLKKRKFLAYAQGVSRKDVWSKYTIGEYHDPRDAAYVAQEFADMYDSHTIDEIKARGAWAETAKEFREGIEIPEWKHTAEGLDFEDMLGKKYKTNYVDNARQALAEAFRISEKKVPNLTVAKKMIEIVEDMVEKGMNYRAAARLFVESV